MSERIEQRIEDLKNRCEKLDEQVTELQQTFDLRWDADQRAIKRWREAHPGNELVMPDHADLCVWLIEERSKLREMLVRADWWISTQPDHEKMTAAIREALGVKMP